MNRTQNSSRSVPPVQRTFVREKWIALFGILMAIALPALLITVGGWGAPSKREAVWDDRQICICRHDGEGEEKQSLSAVLALCLAATNGSDTPAQSLCAQGVALRSRAIWWMDYCTETGEEDDSSVPHLCDSPSHGLPYLSMEELEAMYGKEEAAARLQAGEKAVESTKGMVLCYEGEIVPALLHHSSYGSTRGADQLHWVSVVSTPEEESRTQLKYTVEELRLLLAAAFGVEISPKPWEWSFTVEKDRNGWVTFVKMGEVSVSGDAFAAALSIPSVNFSLQAEKDGLAVTAVGEGSGCGLSRRGAAVYAESGLSWQEILAHYFPKCTVESITAS